MFDLHECDDVNRFARGIAQCVLFLADEDVVEPAAGEFDAPFDECDETFIGDCYHIATTFLDAESLEALQQLDRTRVMRPGSDIIEDAGNFLVYHTSGSGMRWDENDDWAENEALRHLRGRAESHFAALEHRIHLFRNDDGMIEFDMPFR